MPQEDRGFETGMEHSWTFQEHKEWTAKDCEAIAQELTAMAADIRSGNMDSFEKFWWYGGTEEGDAKINSTREIMMLRYLYRKEHLVKEKS